MTNYRKSGNRILKKVLYFYGDGLTEFFYLKHLMKLKLNHPDNFSIHLKRADFGIGNSYKKIKRKIKDISESGKDYLAFYIKDVENNLDSYKKLKENNKNLFIIASNPSIEYWFLLHFEDTNKVFIASELKKYLKKYIPDYSTDENFLEREDWVKNMSDNTSIACERAEKYTNENMSFTSFPLLISELKPK